MNQEFKPPIEEAQKYLLGDNVKRIGLHNDCIEIERDTTIDYVRKSDNQIFRQFKRVD